MHGPAWRNDKKRLHFETWQVHASDYLISQVLKGELGFRGMVVSDYNAINHLVGSGLGFGAALAECVEAGIDMVMTAGGLWGDATVDG